MELANWLREQLRIREWTQSDFARRLNVGTGTVSRWMQGRPPDTSYCDLIADVLHADVDLVLSLAGHRPPVAPDALSDQRRELHALLDRIPLDARTVAQLRVVLGVFVPPPGGWQE